MRAQQTAKLPTIGFLGSASASSMSQWFSVFVQRLRELGWIEGRTVAIEVRWAEGRSERYAEIVGEFIRLNVDLIFTSSTPPTIAAKQATEVIPIVSAVMGDPVGTGLVVSLARPGGNVTGLSNKVADLAAKRLALLREVVPGLRQLGMLANLGNPAVLVEIGELQASARTLGLEVIMLDIRRSEDIAPAFERLKGRAQALYVSGDPLVVVNRDRIITLATVVQIPAIYNHRLRPNRRFDFLWTRFPRPVPACRRLRR